MRFPRLLPYDPIGKVISISGVTMGGLSAGYAAAANELMALLFTGLGLMAYTFPLTVDQTVRNSFHHAKKRVIETIRNNYPVNSIKQEMNLEHELEGIHHMSSAEAFAVSEGEYVWQQ